MSVHSWIYSTEDTIIVHQNRPQPLGATSFRVAFLSFPITLHIVYAEQSVVKYTRSQIKHLFVFITGVTYIIGY